jgi:hypothetical protein
MVTFSASRFRALVRHRILWRAGYFVSFSDRRQDPVVLQTRGVCKLYRALGLGERIAS